MKEWICYVRILAMAFALFAEVDRSHAQSVAPPFAQNTGVSPRYTSETRTPIRRDASAGNPPSASAASSSSNSTGLPGTTSPSVASRTASSPWGTFVILGTMLIVIAIGARWLKRLVPARLRGLPDAAVHWLGKKTIAANQEVHLVKVGERILVLGASPEGLRTLSEITDRAEVAQLEIAARNDSPIGSPPDSQSPLARRTQRPPASTGKSDAIPPGPLGRPTPAERSHRAIGSIVAFLVLTVTASAQSTASRFDPLPAVASGDSSTTIAETALDPFTRPSAQSFEADSTRTVSAAPPTLTSQSGLLAPSHLWSTIRMAALVSIVSLAPAILMMTTCYVRMIVVFGLLRQALGSPQFPPTQVLTALSLFLTGLVMWPVWQRSYDEGIRPYTETRHVDAVGQEAALKVAVERTIQPVRQFMSRQIEATGNESAIDLLLDFRSRGDSQQTSVPTYYEDVPIEVLLPAFLISELKTAFLIGFQIYLPFLILDFVVSSVLASLGMVMLPPSVVSLPFKLLLFVLIDGWYLTVQLLLNSFAPS